jgi:hypothetical protein
MPLGHAGEAPLTRLRLVVAKAVAPTHPHPRVPNTLPSHVLVGPAMALVDRAYDVVRAVLQKSKRLSAA